MSESAKVPPRGRRLPVPEQPGTFTWPTEPGDYCGPILGLPNGKPAVFFLSPDPTDEGLRHVESPPHTFTEEPDGTLTIAPSILCYLRDEKHNRAEGWHGYLERGQWRKV